MALSQDMTFHGLQQLRLTNSSLQINPCIKGIEFEIISMRSTRRAWTSITVISKIVNSMFCAILKDLFRWYVSS